MNRTFEDLVAELRDRPGFEAVSHELKGLVTEIIKADERKKARQLENTRREAFE